MAHALPAGFETLEPFVDRFALATTAERAARRGDSTAEERQAFYEAARTLIDPALDLLDHKKLDALDEQEQRLLNLAMCFSHIALAVEVQGADEARHAQLRPYMRIVHSPSDPQA